MSSQKPNFSAFLSVSIVFIAVSLFIILSAFKHMPGVNTFSSGVYLFLTLIGYTGVIWFVLAWFSFISHKIFKNYFVPAVICSLAIFILFVDIKVYSLYRSHLNGGLLEYVLKEAFSELKRISMSDLLPLAFGLLLGILFIHFLFKYIILRISEASAKKLSRFNYSMFFSFFILSQLTYMYVDVINYIPIKKWTRHIPLYHPLTARRSLIKWGVVDSSKIRKFEMQSNHKDSSINYPKELKCDLTQSASQVKPNILWLFIDSWRFSDYNQETSPQIHSWVKKNKVHTFKNHWSVGGATIPSLFSMFYGVPPLYIKSFTESGTTPIFISKLLKENYKLQISTGWPIDNTTLSKNVFKEVPDLRVSIGDRTAWESDAYMKDEIFSFLRKRDKKNPYFSFMIFDSAHDYSLPPFYPPVFAPFSEEINYLSLGPETDPTKYHNKYKNSVHYIDSIVGDILKSPLIHDKDRPTVIIVSSDHGEQFNDLKRNYWGHNSNFSRYQLKVPLFVLWNDFKPKAKSEKIKHLTSHNDLAHTFMEEVFKCDPSKQQSVGFNLYNDETRTPLLLSTYSKHGMLTKDKIYSYEPGFGYEVYDHNYNELDDVNVPKEISQQYMETSTRFYN